MLTEARKVVTGELAFAVGGERWVADVVQGVVGEQGDGFFALG